MPNVKLERTFRKCGKCGREYPANGLITLTRNLCSQKKNLTKVCDACYNEVLDFLGVEDREME
jgi:hypothetical protein